MTNFDTVSVAVSQVGMTELIFVNPGVKVKGQSITAMSCCLSRCFQQSNVSQNVVYSQNNMLLTAKLVIGQRSRWLGSMCRFLLSTGA